MQRMTTWELQPGPCATALGLSREALHAALREGWLSGHLTTQGWIVESTIALEALDAEATIWDCTAYPHVLRVYPNAAAFAADAEDARAAGWEVQQLATTLRRDPWGLLLGVVGLWLLPRRTSYHVIFRRDV